MGDTKLGRRQAAGRVMTVLGVALVAPAALVGCDGEEASGTLDCSSTSGLGPAGVASRESQGYVERTPNPGEDCAGCRFYTPGAEGACGGCQVVQGPINPGGYCRTWAASS